MPMTSREPSRELAFHPMSGWVMVFALPLYVAFVIVLGVQLGREAATPGFVFFAAASGLLVVALLGGFFIVPPNKARALVLFGRYRGTVRTNGFYWTNPFTVKMKVS